MVNTKIRRLLAIILLTVLFVLTAAFSACAYVTVADNADILGTSVDQITSRAKELSDHYDMVVHCLTTSYTGGKNSAAYMESYYEDHGTDNDQRGGIVLLINMGEREINLVTSGDMRYYISDAREEEIYDAGYEYAADGEYARAMLAMLDKVTYFMQKGIPNNQVIYDTETGRIIRYHSLTMTDILIALISAVVLGVSACVIVYVRYSHVAKYNYSVGQNASVSYRRKEDHLINHYVTKRLIPRAPSGGGKGGSGGSRTSVHRSSGGHSYGGGHGRKF